MNDTALSLALGHDGEADTPSGRAKMYPKMVALRLYPEEMTQLQQYSRAEALTLASMARMLVTRGLAQYEAGRAR